MRDFNSVVVYKNKGDKSDCNNKRNISLLSSVGKVFSLRGPKQATKYREKVNPESQCGFRSKRSTIDMIFYVRQLQKCQVLYYFIDVSKAVDLVSRDGLLKIPANIDYPSRLLRIIQ